MYAILLTNDGRGGRFYSSRNGDALVAVTEEQRRYLEALIRCDGGQLVDLGTAWPFPVTTVDQERRGDPFFPPDEIRAYDKAA